jgi:hypothetical protein
MSNERKDVMDMLNMDQKESMIEIEAKCSRDISKVKKISMVPVKGISEIPNISKCIDPDNFEGGGYTPDGERLVLRTYNLHCCSDCSISKAGRCIHVSEYKQSASITPAYPQTASAVS